MGTMRNNFATFFVLHVLMLSTSQSLPNGYENSSRRNSLADGLTPDDRTTSYPIYDCLFIDPDLPICDVERMLNSDEKITESTSDQHFGEDFLTRSRRNVDNSATARVVVYTIEGCIPPRLPFSLPSCNGISLDNIVDVQRLRPFVVKGVTQSPFVFPEFNYPKWIRMMTRLQSRISSKKDEQQNIVPKEISVEDSSQDVATTKKTILDGSLPNKHLLLGQKSMKSMNKNHKSKLERISSSKSKKFGLKESQDSSASSFIENANNDLEISSRNTKDRVSNMESSLEKSQERSTMTNSEKIEEKLKTTNNRAQNVWKWSNEENQPAIPTIPMVYDPAKQSNTFISKDGSLNEQPAVDDPSNHLGTGSNSRSFLKTTDEEKIETWNDALVSEARRFGRKRREIRLSGRDSLQGIVDESQAHGIAGKSIAGRFQTENFKGTSRSNVFNEDKKYSKSSKTERQGIVGIKDVSTTAIPGLDTENHGNRSKLDNPRLKIDLASRKASWRRALMKDAALGKKHRNYMELPTSRSQ